MSGTSTAHVGAKTSMRVRGAALLDSWLVLPILILAALALRLYGIEAQSLWADEGTSVALATRSFARIAQDAAHDIHPPLYYWTLHIWAQVAGLSVFAVRALSALYGVLVVAVTYL